MSTWILFIVWSWFECSGAKASSKMKLSDEFMDVSFHWNAVRLYVPIGECFLVAHVSLMLPDESDVAFFG